MHMIYLIMRFLLACYFNFLNYMISSQFHDMNVFIDIILEDRKCNL